MATIATVTFEHCQGPHRYRVAEAELPVRLPMVGLTSFGLAVGRLTALAQDDPAPPDEEARPATGEDLMQATRNAKRGAEALEQCRGRVAEHGLPMKLHHAFWSLDGRQLSFFFTAPGRVDFRGLLRDLVHEFRVPLRLEQVGERDVARLLGGIGRCGRETCCTAWMPHFEPVSVHHARLQGLAPVPAHLGGCCGKLRCCLRFECPVDDDGERRCGRRDRRPGNLKTATLRDDEDAGWDES
ncbi:MAG: stage 0 sporulation family protein [Armatimonadetes bacterium]|nr:stage 0 sporulation family protein [Armatimonadota bacterium]